MTVPSEVNRSGPYLGNGVTTVFEYKFKIVNQAHLRVARTDAAGNETVLTLGTNYTVAGVGNAGGGAITVSPAPASGQSITILRAMPFTQNLDLENQGAYYAEDVERAFDEAAMRDQQMAESLNRSLKIPSSAEDPDGTLAARLASGINQLADRVDNIDTVAANVDAVNAVADNIGNVNTVADNIAGVNAVADNIGNVNTVAGIAGNINTVAGDHDEIVALAGITGNINVVAGIAPDVEAVAGVADDIPTIAENITDVAAFGKIYLGPKTSDPTVRNNGTALMGGDLYFNTGSKMLRVYDGTAWQAAAGQSLNMAAQSFTGNGSTTAFTLAMAPAVAANILVWQGGVRQVPITDYTVSGSTLTFVTAPGNGEAIDTLVVSTVSTLYAPANQSVVPASFAAGFAPTIESRAKVATAALPAVLIAFATLGYAAAADGGGAIYKRVASQPSHAGKVQSSDGAWWEIDWSTANARSFGAKGDGVTNDAAAINNLLSYCSTVGMEAIIPAGTYICGSSELFLGNVPAVRGAGKGATRLKFTKTTGTAISGTINAVGGFSRQLELTGFTVSNTAFGGVGIYVGGSAGVAADRTTNRLTVRDVFVTGEAGAFADGFGDGLTLVNVTNALVDAYSFRGKVASTGEPNYDSGSAISYNGGAITPHHCALTITNSFISYCQFAVNCYDFEGVLIDKTQIVGVNKGVVFAGPVEYPHASVVNSHINAASTCIEVTNVKQVVISNNCLYVELGAFKGKHIEFIGASNSNVVSGNIFENLKQNYACDSVVLGNGVHHTHIIGNTWHRTNGVASDNTGLCVWMQTGSSWNKAKLANNMYNGSANWAVNSGSNNDVA